MTMYGQPEPLQPVAEHPSDVRRRAKYARQLEVAVREVTQAMDDIEKSEYTVLKADRAIGDYYEVQSTLFQRLRERVARLRAVFGEKS